jgi:hypothetical protein
MRVDSDAEISAYLEFILMQLSNYKVHIGDAAGIVQSLSLILGAEQVQPIFKS